MAVLGTFKQTPTERKLYNIDYSNWLQPGEVLTGATFVGIPSTPLPPCIVDAFEIMSGTAIAAYISGGVDGTLYQILATVTTSIGQTKEDEIRINCAAPPSV